MEWIFPLVGGLGIGSIATTVTNHYLSKKNTSRDLKYKEKRETYLGILEALHRAAVEPSEANSKNFALWQTRVQLFGSQEVADAAQGIVDTNNGPREKRDHYFKTMIQEMKDDLWSGF